MHHTRKFLHWPIDSGNYQSEGMRVFVCLYGEIDTVCSNQGGAKENLGVCWPWDDAGSKQFFSVCGLCSWTVTECRRGRGAHMSGGPRGAG